MMDDDDYGPLLVESDPVRAWFKPVQTPNKLRLYEERAKLPSRVPTDVLFFYFFFSVAVGRATGSHRIIHPGRERDRR